LRKIGTGVETAADAARKNCERLGFSFPIHTWFDNLS